MPVDGRCAGRGLAGYHFDSAAARGFDAPGGADFLQAADC